MGWASRKLGELADISRGSSPRPIKDQKYFNGGIIPWIKIADATKSGKFLYETKQYVNDHGASFSRILDPGTIIVAASGTLGYTQILGVRGCAHDGWLILQNLRELNRDFAYYALKTVKRHLYNSAYGAAIQNINTEILRETKIPCPPLPTQRRIADILSAYDDLIENNLRRIQILEEMARNLYREWFVKFRFPLYRSDGTIERIHNPETDPMVDSELGPIPEGWEVKELQDVADMVMGQSPKSEFYNESGKGLPFHQGVSDYGYRYPNDRIYSTGGTRYAEKDDILFSVRAPVGRLNVANKKIILGRGLAGIRSNSRHQIFLYHQISDLFQEEDLMGGGTIYKSVTKKDMQTLRMITPSSMPTVFFEEHAEPVFRQIETLVNKGDILANTRDLLLPRLVSGQLDVSEFDEQLQEVS